jgi:hypothetical protein
MGFAGARGRVTPVTVGVLAVTNTPRVNVRLFCGELKIILDKNAVLPLVIDVFSNSNCSTMQETSHVEQHEGRRATK